MVPLLLPTADMKAIRIHQFGGPEQVLIEEIKIPALQRGEALVRVRAAGVNPVDWMIRERIYNPEGADRVPLTLGQDFSGVIELISPGTKTEFKEGDEVLGEAWGAFAEFAALPVADLVRKPAEIDFVTAASIPMPALTAWQVVVDTARAHPGMSFLIHGASGGVGSFAAQFAILRGAEVIATASPPSFDYLRSIGVKEIINYQTERFEEKVKDVDVVIDPLGGDIQARSWPVLKKGGMLINLVGEIDEESAQHMGVEGVDFGMTYDTAALEEIVRLVALGKVKPHVSAVLTLAEARHAMNLNQSGGSHGKIVLKVA
jgi:NADPH:quinone reductase-like Zn-dependent oxidoreductase